jgi:hypothetical protein
MIAVKTKFVSSLTEMERRFSVPLQFIGDYLATTIIARISRGEGAKGPFTAYGAHSDVHSQQQFWVPPEYTQPEGYVFRVEKGKYAGWAVYRNYAVYAAIVYAGAPRKLHKSGSFLRSIAMRVINPAKVKIAPYGIHPPSRSDPKRRPNTNIGYLASRFELMPLFAPTDVEIRAVGAILRDEVVGQAIEAAITANVGTQARRRASSASRRASKLLGDLR